MTLRFSLLSVFAMLVFCGSLLGQSKAVTKTKDDHNTFDSHALKGAWLLFANAVKVGDKSAIKELSTPCINCVDCLVNTPKEDSLNIQLRQMHPDTWYEEMFEHLCYIDIDEFMRDDLPIIFDEATKARLLDSSKLIFADNEHNKRLYKKQCILSSSQPKRVSYAEVFITVIDSTPKREGLQKAFAFIRVGGSYKFCGYATIP